MVVGAVIEVGAVIWGRCRPEWSEPSWVGAVMMVGAVMLVEAVMKGQSNGWTETAGSNFTFSGWSRDSVYTLKWMCGEGPTAIAAQAR